MRSSGTLIIVEGKKDKASLERLGLSNIITLSKKPLFSIIEDPSKSSKECAMLTDLDKKGKELYGKLNSGMSMLGVRVNNGLREFLQENTGVCHMEGISRHIDNLSLKSGKHTKRQF